MDEKLKGSNKSFNDDEKCFQYTATVISNHEEHGKSPQRISKIKPFMNKYTWKRRNYPSGKDEK